MLPPSVGAHVSGACPRASNASAISSLAPEADELWTEADFARLEEIEREARWRGDDLAETFLEDQRILDRLAQEARERTREPATIEARLGSALAVLVDVPSPEQER